MLYGNHLLKDVWEYGIDGLDLDYEPESSDERTYGIYGSRMTLFVQYLGQFIGPMSPNPEKLLIVDGYNVLRSGSRYRWQPRADEDYTDDFFNAARDRLINDVVNYAGRDMGAIIVFDAADNELSQGSRTKIGGVQVIFSPAGQSADKVIEKLAYDAGKRGVETMVVTSDAAIQDTVFGGGVDRMSADGFSHEMGEYYEDARLDDTPKVARKNTVAERIPADTLARLKALRDGR